MRLIAKQLRQLEVYPFGGHEVRGVHVEKELAWLRSHLASVAES